jgi:Uma2 family endonuclease
MKSLTKAHPAPSTKTLADVVARLGGVPLERVIAVPAMGTATAADVIQERASPERRLCELIDGTLVEKPMGAKESILACYIIRLLGNHVQANRLGVVLGPDGMLQLFPGRIRIPDVSFIPWDQIPGRKWPDEPIPEIPPDLAVEVLSPSNTASEIRLKRRDYFQAGTRLVWVIDPKKLTARTYTAPDASQAVGKSGSLDGGEVLPGFRVSLPELFGCLHDGPTTGG